ncbi:MAG: hypothetical protein D6712_13090 [Chloroflexi bacterium]|nr:MAG: hypothetical protein D6712_13090 [Chloroflexota bacterium]
MHAKLKSLAYIASGLACWAPMIASAAQAYVPPGVQENTGTLADRLDAFISLLMSGNVFIVILAGLVGSVFLFLGITGWRKQTQRGDHADYKGPITSIIVGAILLSFATWQGVLATTTVADDRDNKVEAVDF